LPYSRYPSDFYPIVKSQTQFNCDVKIGPDGTFDIWIKFDEATIKILCKNDLE